MALVLQYYAFIMKFVLYVRPLAFEVSFRIIEKSKYYIFLYQRDIVVRFSTLS